MLNADKFSISINAKSDVLDIQKGELMAKLQPADIVPGQAYEVTVESNATYHNGSLPVKKVVIYNTTNDQKDGWFYIVEEGKPITIKAGSSGMENNKVYAFFIDIYSQDNEGGAKVYFKPC